MSRVRALLGDVYIVADGMGGHRGGAVAAELAIEILARNLSGVRALSSAAAVTKTAFEEANGTVYERGHSGDAETQGMGTTAVVLIMGGSQAMIAHVGDSRAYLFADGELRRLTKDHSRVQRMVDAGILTDAEAASHPDTNLLERAIGVSPDVTVDISAWFELNDGDQILLCSDGLHGYVSDSEISTILNKRTAPQVLADQLVDLALQKGGEDNITVQLIEYHNSDGRRRTPILGDSPLYQLSRVSP